MNCKEFTPRNLTWEPVKDWRGLTITGSCGAVSKLDIECFITNLVHECSRKLNIPYEVFNDTFKKENTAFYELFEYLFKRFSGLSLTGDSLSSLQSLLRAPVIDEGNDPTVDKVLTTFMALSDNQKLEVLKKLGEISITFNYSVK